LRLTFDAACWVPIIYFFFPETKGLELEDVDRLFAKEGTEAARSMSIAVVRRLSVDLRKKNSDSPVEEMVENTDGNTVFQEV
jgi:hypothetical protein